LKQAAASSEAAIGFRVKTGWTAAVLVAGPVTSPRPVVARRLELCDPTVPETRQPYHGGFGTAQGDEAKVERLVGLVSRYGRRVLTEWLEQSRGAYPDLRGVGVVAGSLVDPKTVRNQHMRAHANEGRLYRDVVCDAIGQARLSCVVIVERDLYATAKRALGRSESEVRSTLSELGKALDGPWRAEEKAACLAAWLVLAG
jgi:hypothetical protein